MFSIFFFLRRTKLEDRQSRLAAKRTPQPQWNMQFLFWQWRLIPNHLFGRLQKESFGYTMLRYKRMGVHFDNLNTKFVMHGQLCSVHIRVGPNIMEQQKNVWWIWLYALRLWNPHLLTIFRCQPFLFLPNLVHMSHTYTHCRVLPLLCPRQQFSENRIMAQLNTHPERSLANTHICVMCMNGEKGTPNLTSNCSENSLEL